MNLLNFLINLINLIGITIIGFLIFIVFYTNILYEYMEIYSLLNEYDYIIVGAGSAGSVVALRLAQNKNNKILLIEAGSKQGPLFNVPFIGTLFLQQSPYDWNYVTKSQENACLALENNRSVWPAGKIVGGTGQLNNMIYARGLKTDYDHWYKDYKDYDYERDVLWYFKKSEKQLGIYANDDKYHSRHGVLYVSDLVHSTIISDLVLQGVQKLGYSVKDLNRGDTEGFMRPQINQRKGKRWSTGSTLLEFLPQKENLHLLTNAQVTKVLFNNSTAQSVRFQHFGKTFQIFARKEVILSAGVIGTPKILMLSGIGPSDYLTSLKISVLNDLPVGNNLQDHLTTGLDLVEINTTLSINLFSLTSPFAIWDYFYNSNGSWTTPGAEVLGIIKTKDLSQLGFMVMPLGFTFDKGIRFRHLVGLSQHQWDNYFSLATNRTMITILPVLLHPKSVGTVRLRDNNPLTKPVIDPKYLSSKEDVEILIQGIRFIEKLVETEPMKKVNAKIFKKKVPGCEEFHFGSDLYWECYIRHFTFTSYHPVGTCKLGHRSDGSTVVDYSFKVHNTENLRIADASVIPYLPSTNINAAVVMIAEKVVDEIYFNEFLKRGSCSIKEIFINDNFCNVFY